MLFRILLHLKRKKHQFGERLLPNRAISVALLAIILGSFSGLILFHPQILYGEIYFEDMDECNLVLIAGGVRYWLINYDGPTRTHAIVLAREMDLPSACIGKILEVIVVL